MGALLVPLKLVKSLCTLRGHGLKLPLSLAGCRSEKSCFCYFSHHCDKIPDKKQLKEGGILTYGLRV